ncbi:hypothetical protein MMC30_001777 [Trapelia coarctata]|nr:hypothetical protein [Trapelia coarctata]
MTVVFQCRLGLTHTPTKAIYQTLSRNLLLPRQTLRLASTAAATRVVHNTTVNPPSSTLPAPLVLPVRSPSQSAPSYYILLGKAYLAFYKTGAKAVYTNFKASQATTSRLPPSTSIPDALEKGLLSRAEWQLIRRSRQDIKKVPLFALVFMICGEFTPLVVVFMAGVVPRTCMIPKQVQRMREKLEARRGRSFRDGTLESEDQALRSTLEVDDLKGFQLVHIGRSLGLYPELFDRFFGGFPTAVLRARVRRWKEYLELDDVAIEKNGGVGQMEMEEVRIAAEERGLDVLGENDTQLRGVLKDWLAARKNQSVTKLLLTRPSIWAKTH